MTQTPRHVPVQALSTEKFVTMSSCEYGTQKRYLPPLAPNSEI